MPPSRGHVCVCDCAARWCMQQRHHPQPPCFVCHTNTNVCLCDPLQVLCLALQESDDLNTIQVATLTTFSALLPITLLLTTRTALHPITLLLTTCTALLPITLLFTFSALQAKTERYSTHSRCTFESIWGQNTSDTSTLKLKEMHMGKIKRGFKGQRLMSHSLPKGCSSTCIMQYYDNYWLLLCVQHSAPGQSSSSPQLKTLLFVVIGS